MIAAAGGGAPGRIRVKALGLLVGRLPGGGPLDLPLGPGETLTAAEVMAAAGIPDEEVFIIIVNGRRARPEHPVGPGDEVVFVPPVAGG